MQFLFSSAVQSAIYISFPSLSQCGHFHLQLSQDQSTVELLPSFSRWKSSNQSHCNLKSNVKMSIHLFGLPCWSLVVQNIGIHYAGVHKIPWDVFPCLDWEVASIISHTHLSMMVYTIHVPVVQLNVLWLIYLGHITTQSPVCVNISWVFNMYWQVLQFYCLAKQWSPSLSYHPGRICKHHRSFYQVYNYHLEDISYSLKLSHCSMFYKPASPSITEQM